jgi:hypothetical protein
MTVGARNLWVTTVIREYFVVKKFRFARSDENFLRENSLPVQTYTANIWRAIDMYENIITQKFLTQKFYERKLINMNYGMCIMHLHHVVYHAPIKICGDQVITIKFFEMYYI